ncbi:methylmalonyl Co-A mutase-associated GTPase MeaB [Nocardiopsis sp. HNM0947]|uniref:Methylmalonyl Co-A mutase-associated GTPase MeaB n=1 Tax=Nocardiopsis coralli TaxID=2772213 RepID=A0ABR9P4Z7_9ACTN|nr:methylmalonyl Co-A mutase-associated GTPase MeaB [Nocardiopsis coralli]MBE2998820.1 methylmalonyl Co-A mutase-associated GTPase MeaB [Nocardiopsis coralli]
MSVASSTPNTPRRRRPVDVPALAEGVLSGHRPTLARAITLVESRRPDHTRAAQDLLVRLLPHAGKAQRVGITGVPGVGKSTFIDAFGSMLTADGHRVAVLAVDPSSSRTGGSILGDKTRMERLATDPNAFIRPSPTAGTLGGVARATRETMLLMEAAGFDVVLVETVGVGQSEITVADMVDCFVFLTLARTGDQLQGIKKGVLELVDVVAVNKADGPHADDARKAARELSRALRLLQPLHPDWRPPVLTCSGMTGDGLERVWSTVEEHRDVLSASGELDRRRSSQRVSWMWDQVRDQLMDGFLRDPDVSGLIPGTEDEVRSGETTATLAARRLLEAFTQRDGARGSGDAWDGGGTGQVEAD